jgi:hypothetical protein
VSCLDCGTPLAGPFCSECGQQARDPDPTFRELVGEAWDAFASVDGRVLASIRLLLLRPGALTDEYLRGRRTRYLAPLRLYLLCSVAYFLASSVVPDRPKEPSITRLTTGTDTIDLSSRGDSIEKVANRQRKDSLDRVLLTGRGIAVPVVGPLDSASRAMGDSIRMHDQLERLTRAPRWLRRRLLHGLQRVTRDNRSFGNDFKAQLPRLMFVLMPVFALLLMLAYRSRRRRYPVHLIVSLHLHAFIFAMMTLGAAVDWMPGRVGPSVIGFLGMLWCLAYFPLALRRVYGGRLRFAVARSLLLGTEYAILGSLAFGVLGFGLLLLD